MTPLRPFRHWDPVLQLIHLHPVSSYQEGMRMGIKLHAASAYMRTPLRGPYAVLSRALLLDLQ
jgi:hypothetical protein